MNSMLTPSRPPERNAEENASGALVSQAPRKVEKSLPFTVGLGKTLIQNGSLNLPSAGWDVSIEVRWESLQCGERQ